VILPESDSARGICDVRIAGKEIMSDLFFTHKKYVLHELPRTLAVPADLLAGLLCFCWLKHEEDEEEPTTVQKHSREGYNLAALLFFFLFLDNLLRRVEGQGWKGFWPCSGRFEVVVLFGMLSLVAQFVYWSWIVSGLNQEHA